MFIMVSDFGRWRRKGGGFKCKFRNYKLFAICCCFSAPFVRRDFLFYNVGLD